MSLFTEVESILTEVRREVIHGIGQNRDFYITRLESLISVIEDASDDPDSSTSETLAHLHYRICHFLSQLTCNANATCSTVTPISRPTIYSSNGAPGRPRVFINIEMVEFLRSASFTWNEIADLIGVSRSTLWRRLSEHDGIPHRFSDVSDDALDSIISQYQNRNPHTGQTILRGYLESIGIRVQRQRIRESVWRTDPLRRLVRWHGQLSRRTYKVPGANSLWHIDGHHSLIRWRFVIHGGIDGYSRMIVFLRCATNNRAMTAFSAFSEAIDSFGIPSRMRSDRGGENTIICQFMIAVRGCDRGSHIAGPSTHNQRIERLWRDVYRCVCATFYEIFYNLEICNELDPTNEVHLFALHCLYLPLINMSLQEFTRAWNHHPIRTERNWSPRKIWTNSILHGDHQEVDVDDWNMYGYDYGGPILHDDDGLNIVEVPETLEHLSVNFRELYITELGNRSVATFSDAYLLLQHLMTIHGY